MYIMAKTDQNLQLLARDVVHELSILVASSTINQRGSRKSSSLTNGMSPGTNKTALREYGTEARGLDLSPFYNHLSMRPSWASADALSTAPRRRH